MKIDRQSPIFWVCVLFIALAGIWELAASKFAVYGQIYWDGWFALAGIYFAVLLIFETTVRRPLLRLGRTIQAMGQGNPAMLSVAKRLSWLPDFAERLQFLAEKLSEARKLQDKAVAAAITSAEIEKARLATLLNELHEGVIVCNNQNQLVLYNQSAAAILHVLGEIGLGRPLYSMLEIEPIQHCLDVLRTQTDDNLVNLPFLTTSPDGRYLLQGRVGLIMTDHVLGSYVLTFTDATDMIAALSQRDALLGQLMSALNSVKQIAEAIENVPPKMKENIVSLHQHASLIYEMQSDGADGWWPMADIHSTNLFSMAAARLEKKAIFLTMTGMPCWFYADGYTLLAAIEELVIQIFHYCHSIGSIDLSVAGDHGVNWISLSWCGEAVDHVIVRNWCYRPIATALGGLSVEGVLRRHSKKEIKIKVEADVVTLSFAVPLAREHPSLREVLPSRPEFFDFSLLNQSARIDQGEKLLRELVYVVFDIETTGLSPTAGDEIVSIAGVRVVNGRILTGETFNRLVNPGRPIPAESTRFHGITDEMVANKPPLPLVFQQFHGFARDSVLVGHNVAFDLKFLHMKEEESGVNLNNIALDTMLFSEFIDGPGEEDESLDALTLRYDVPIIGRHTALGDAMATAALLLHFIDLLEERGIRTLNDALTTLDITMQLHNRKQAFT